MSSDREINDILVHLINEIWRLEEKAVITGEFTDITNNDMHIIEAIGTGAGNNMSAIAKKLKITVGSLTTSMSSLVFKKYVVRERSEKDRRLVCIRLTEKGEKAYLWHQYFHEQMVTAALKGLNEQEQEVLRQVLEQLVVFFRGYQGPIL